jgi:hypothetical protein
MKALYLIGATTEFILALHNVEKGSLGTSLTTGIVGAWLLYCYLEIKN